MSNLDQIKKYSLIPKGKVCYDTDTYEDCPFLEKLESLEKQFIPRKCYFCGGDVRCDGMESDLYLDKICGINE